MKRRFSPIHCLHKIMRTLVKMMMGKKATLYTFWMISFCLYLEIFSSTSCCSLIVFFLYPTQRVAEGIMFLTRPSVSQSVSQSVSPVFLVSATPLKPLDRILWNFVVMKDIMCTCAYPQKILIPCFFSNLPGTPFLNFKIWQKWKILLKQLVSTIPLKPLNRIAWNFTHMCRYAFLQEMLIWSFWGAIYIPFFVRLPVTNAWNCHSLYTAFSSFLSFLMIFNVN